MSLPALRQPKLLKTPARAAKKDDYEQNYVILTLKNETKLVVNSDAYHGIIADEAMFKCVFCETCIELDNSYKEVHKNSLKHHSSMNEVPYVEEFGDDLVRKLNKAWSYCMVCHVELPTYSVARHVSNESHKLEMGKARTRASAYKPYPQT